MLALDLSLHRPAQQPARNMGENHQSRRMATTQVPFLNAPPARARAGSSTPFSKDHACQPHLAIILTSPLSVVWFRGQIGKLREAGFRVTLISSPGPLTQEAQAEGAEVIAVPMERGIAPFRDLVSLWRLWRTLRRTRPDIINVGTPKAGLLGGIAARLAFLRGRIYTIHGLRFETARGFTRTLLRWTERIACHNAQYVRCVSPSVRERAIQFGVLEPEKAYVIGAGSTNGIDCDHYQAAKNRSHGLRLALGIPSSAKVVGFVGRFTRDKGINDLYKAYYRLRCLLPDLHLLLVGCFEDLDPIDPGIRNQLQSDKNVHFAGLVLDTAPYYHVMDVLAFPTHREGLGLVSLEAQAAGVPVVATNATGAVDSLLEEITGKLVPVCDEEALAAALLEILTDPEKRLRMGRAGAKWVRRQFQCDLIWDALLQDYRRILREESDNRVTQESVFDRIRSPYRTAQSGSVPVPTSLHNRNLSNTET
jgi:glycosyltransferase involved in cell wall biosynthesis